MIKLIVLTLLMVSALFSNPSRELCMIVKGCFLSQSLEGCADVERIGPSRCIEAQELDARHVMISDSVGSQLYDFLGHKHRIMYTLVDTIDVSPAKLSYLLDDLPFATKIVNYFQHTPYIFEYTKSDHTRFNVAKGEGVKGRVNIVSGSTDEHSLYYFGNGTVIMGFLTLEGPAFITLKYQQIPKMPNRSLYMVRVIVVVNNGIVSSIMNMGLVRDQVDSKIQEILDDVVDAARMANDRDLVLRGPWTDAERRKIEILLEMP